MPRCSDAKLTTALGIPLTSGPFNEDGNVFIRRAADSVLAASVHGECAVIRPKPLPRSARSGQPAPEPTKVPVPPTISHFVMNLPASAIEFLPAYRGIYAGRKPCSRRTRGESFPSFTCTASLSSATDDVPKLDVCERISKELGMEMRLGDPDKDNEVAVHYVRAVAPAKSMYCASFRLPAAVAFAAR